MRGSPTESVTHVVASIARLRRSGSAVISAVSEWSCPTQSSDAVIKPIELVDHFSRSVSDLAATRSAAFLVEACFPKDEAETPLWLSFFISGVGFFFFLS